VIKQPKRKDETTRGLWGSAQFLQWKPLCFKGVVRWAAFRVCQKTPTHKPPIIFWASQTSPCTILYETEKLEGEKQSKGKQHGWRTRPSSEILLPPCLKRSPLACAAHLEVDIVHQIFSMLAWIVNIFLSTFTWMLTFSMLFFSIFHLLTSIFHFLFPIQNMVLVKELFRANQSHQRRFL